LGYRWIIQQNTWWDVPEFLTKFKKDRNELMKFIESITPKKILDIRRIIDRIYWQRKRGRDTGDSKNPKNQK
jgi:hypothetical protein